MKLTHCAVQISKPPASALEFQACATIPPEPRISDSGHFLFCNHLISLWLLILGHFYELVCVVRLLFVLVLATFSMYSTTELYSESVLWFIVFSF